MINAEYLAISAIFIAGLYVGFKLNQALIEIKAYVQKRREQ